MKRALILTGIVTILCCAATAKAVPPADPLLCSIANGKYTFHMDDTDFKDLVGALRNLDQSGAYYTTTLEQTRAAFLAKSEDSRARISICETRLLVRMLRDGKPRKATWNDISPSGDLNNYSPAFMPTPAELKLLDPLLAVPLEELARPHG